MKSSNKILITLTINSSMFEDGTIMSSITEADSLTFNGRYIMQLMSDYVSPQGE